MKPVRLTIEGINSFIQPQTLDFEAVGRNNLFCIGGKTGAGKTTIFDCIMLALYGKSGKGDLADVVNLSLMSARVALDFSEGGEMYTAERTIKCRREKSESGERTEKRSAVSDCVLYKNGEPIAKGNDASSYIAGVVGLEASEFKNVYLLEQGEYAEFLKKTPSKQTEAVGKIFSLMRFGDVQKLAGERARTESAAASGLMAEAQKIGDATRDTLHQAKQAAQTLRTRTATLIKERETRFAELAELEKARDAFIAVREKQNAVKSLMIQADEAKSRESAARAASAEYEKSLDPSDGKRLSDCREKLNRLSALNSLDREAAAAQKDSATKRAAFETKKSAGAQIEREYADMLARRDFDNAALCAMVSQVRTAVQSAAERATAFDRAADVLNAHSVGTAQIVEARGVLAAAKREYDGLVAARAKLAAKVADHAAKCESKLAIIQKYADELKSIEEKKAAAAAVESAAVKALAVAQLGSHSAAVRAELQAGDVCPVCGGVYHGGGGDCDTDVERRKAEHSVAANEFKTIETAERECIKTSEKAKSDYERECDGKRESENELRNIELEIKESRFDPDLYVAVAALLDRAKGCTESAAKSNDLCLRGEAQALKIKAETDAAQKAAESAEQKAKEYKAELGELYGKTGEEIAKVKAATAELENKIAESEQKRAKLSSEAESAAAAVAAIEKSLQAARAECPVDMPMFDEDGYTEKRESAERLAKQIAENERDIAVKAVEIATLEEKCKRLDELKAEIAVKTQRAKIYSTIEEMTKGKKMLNYVAAEYIAEFTSIASDILNELSSGKYTMGYDRINGFTVSDYLNGGKSRKTDTLSGGELFLASLSVAIAIARTQSRGNNAFFFLDEGFGTLDDELIDVVYSALESLSSDCLVGVITHAEALIAKMPSCVTVYEPTDDCGSRIEY